MAVSKKPKNSDGVVNILIDPCGMLDYTALVFNNLGTNLSL
jgi:hypothetical protein